MTSEIELVYFTGCPNVEVARTNLSTALAELGQDAHWHEWNLDDSGAPERVRGFASPAVLVGGVHVAGDQPLASPANSCNALGAPLVSIIRRALEKPVVNRGTNNP